MLLPHPFPFLSTSVWNFRPFRDYRRYFYTHKQTGKTQWDYPDADDIKTEDAKAKDGKVRNKSDLDMEISSTSDRLKDYRE